VIGEVAPADLTRFLGAVGRLAGIDSNDATERIALIYDDPSMKGKIVIKAPKPDETTL